MGYSINFYLDHAISEKSQNSIQRTGSAEEKLGLKKTLLGNRLQVYLYLRWPGSTIKVYTERKCTQHEWDFEKQRVNHNVFKRGASELNEYFNNLENKVSRLYEASLLEKQFPTKTEVKAIIDEANLRDKIDHKVDLFAFTEEYIKSCANTVKPATITAYHSTVRHLKNYSEARRVKLYFENIDLKFYNDFVDYMVKDLNLVNNSMGKYLRVLKVFLGAATEAGVNKTMHYKNTRFKAPSEETESIYLTEEEINVFYRHDLSGNRRLDEARDRFVAGCWLGVRFSDLNQINGNEDIERRDEVEYIKIRTIKTDKFVFIPLHPIVKEIFNKYNGILPKPISNQKMNDYIKEVGKGIPELQSKIATSKTQGKVRINAEPIEKYKLVCTHTARRSFATNLYLQGVPAYTIMQITGHKTEKAFLRYVKVSSLQYAELLHKHYEGQQLKVQEAEIV
jgi:integrase